MIEAGVRTQKRTKDPGVSSVANDIILFNRLDSRPSFSLPSVCLSVCLSAVARPCRSRRGLNCLPDHVPDTAPEHSVLLNPWASQILHTIENRIPAFLSRIFVDFPCAFPDPDPDRVDPPAPVSPQDGYLFVCLLCL